MSLLFPPTGSKPSRLRFNPRPQIPNTGWKLKNEFPDLSGAKVICLDVETKDPEIEEAGPGWARGRGHIIGLALGTDDGWARYYPMRHEGYQNHNSEDVLDYARRQLGRAHQPKVGHNIIYDLGWLTHEGVDVAGEIHDTWTAEKLLRHSADASLEECGQRYLGEGKDSLALYDWAWQYWGKGRAKNTSEKRKLAMQNLWRVPPELVGFYAESDVTLPIEIARKQFDKLEKKGLWDVYRMECDLIPLLVQMRMEGVQVDLDAAERAFKEFGDAIIDVQGQVDRIAGRPINTGSSQEIAPVFDRLKIQYPRTEKTGAPSFKGEFLKTLDHPIGALIIELEDLKKMQSSFIKGQILEKNVNSKVYCTFKPLTAVTGRMSCADPNLQQTPSRGNLAKTVKRCFVPDIGHVEWRDYDFNSIESRVLGHFAVGPGSKELRKEYKRNPMTDYHNFTQAMIKELVGLELNRKHVKNVNFAGIYGASEKKLQRMMSLSDEEARTFFDAYHEGLPYVRETMKFMSAVAEDRGYTTTIMGRRAVFDRWEPRYTPRGAPKPFALKFNAAIKEYGPNIKRAYLHKAANYVIQGSAADLMKAAMVKCWKDGVFDVIGVPRLVIHDALEFSVARLGKKVEHGFVEMKHIMETAIPFKVPVRVSGDHGPNWGDLEEIK